ncbi:MAG TPA: hypothetical protein VFN70_18090 [Burkholderiales bacterium]|nr:hypothetical protein [Burkholderiales bacterium]
MLDETPCPICKLAKDFHTDYGAMRCRALKAEARVAELETALRGTRARTGPDVAYLECCWCSGHTHVETEGPEDIDHDPNCTLVELGLIPRDAQRTETPKAGGADG